MTECPLHSGVEQRNYCSRLMCVTLCLCLSVSPSLCVQLLLLIDDVIGHVTGNTHGRTDGACVCIKVNSVNDIQLSAYIRRRIHMRAYRPIINVYTAKKKFSGGEDFQWVSTLLSSKTNSDDQRKNIFSRHKIAAIYVSSFDFIINTAACSEILIPPRKPRLNSNKHTRDFFPI